MDIIIIIIVIIIIIIIIIIRMLYIRFSFYPVGLFVDWKA